ncbi:hydroxymethylpyrimidine/phosphomethylpyrimidine kinase [Galbibacter pacificus]|uniref:hydroxymethylpyrimidine kinase n=1 Tax=Galbibacter pacificus TaxID=2996052 RepID=A0ABT6FS84_9FLAO|nr:hydroxymethylpyrimidine/phosphomethylpyrimidine kinase [Galbibacter pacificus]MDG3582775.1 hydroxymethylpyrimidine/phosphomethylpyrimidine kinase [Galbibacter pacificus]MDG3586106.1 hydroxymethylpyrimidine/phosphomethylpyrimidine kinase [Galbibacter pacificus]
MMRYMDKRPFVLSIAGFDPSAGAGLLADIKTIEAIKAYGLGVCTANTVQTDEGFYQCEWTNPETIKFQLQVLLKAYKIKAVKIGIVQNEKLLNELLDMIKKYNSNTKIVLDPVLKSTSGHRFQQAGDFLSEETVKKITLLTPNYEEIEQLRPLFSMERTIKALMVHTNILLKGGHHPAEKGKDVLYEKGKENLVLFPLSTGKIYEKHGSGCVLSSAITTYLALGLPLHEACKKAKQYTESILISNTTKLGYHLWK